MRCATSSTGRWMLLGALLPLCSGAVGPDFERPKPAGGRIYDTPHPGTDDGGKAAGVKMTLGADIPAQWWQLFSSVTLDETLHEAIAGSPTMASAQDNLAVSRKAVT